MNTRQLFGSNSSRGQILRAPSSWYYVNSRKHVDSEKIRVPDEIWTHDPPWSSRMLYHWATGASVVSKGPTPSLRVGYLNEVQLKPWFRKSLDLQITLLVGYFKKTNVLLVYFICFHETFHNKWCFHESVRQTENGLERGFVKHRLNWPCWNDWPNVFPRIYIISCCCYFTFKLNWTIRYP